MCAWGSSQREASGIPPTVTITPHAAHKMGDLCWMLVGGRWQAAGTLWGSWAVPPVGEALSLPVAHVPFLTGSCFSGVLSSLLLLPVHVPQQPPSE